LRDSTTNNRGLKHNFSTSTVKLVVRQFLPRM